MFELPSRSKKSQEDASSGVVPNYFSRREQMRLLVMVGSLMLVIVLAIEASKPKNWEFMWAGAKPGLADAEIANEDIDTRLSPQPDTSPRLQADEFLSPPDEPATIDEDTGQANADGYFAGVQPQLLETIRDDMLLRPGEAEAWYHLWGILNSASEDDLEQASVGHIGFVQLFKQAKEYRGRLVTVRGTVRRADREDAYENDYGIEDYWICWLLPAGGPPSPIIVYCLDMPPGFPSGEDLREEVTFTGFSFKRKAYQSKGRGGGGETRTSPLVMAKIGQWTPELVETPPTSSPYFVTFGVLAIVGAALLAAGIAVVVYRRSSSMSATAENYSRLVGKARSEDLAALAETDLGPDVGEKLGRMAAGDDGASES